MKPRPRLLTARWTGRRYEVPPHLTGTASTWCSPTGERWFDSSGPGLMLDFDACEIRLVGGPQDGAVVLVD